MITKIDWLGWTLVLGEGRYLDPVRMLQEIALELQSFSTLVYDGFMGGYSFEPTKGRAPYSMGFARSDHGLYIYAHPNLEHVLFELTGQGCDSLKSQQHPLGILEALVNRLTRIDIACDMLCTTDPLEFVALRDAGRFKTHSEFVSEKGTTCYVGSRSSARYARVYRYNAPHERAHLLRAEHVCKGKDAQLTAKSILSNGIAAVAVSLGEAYGWSHEVWTPKDVAAAEISVWRPERHSGKTLFWLNSAVAPAIRKLIREQGFDPYEWLDTVLRELKGGELDEQID